MSELYQVVSRPEVSEPVVVVGLDGWIDAGFGAAGAMAHLLKTLDTTLVATFDADGLVDHRSRRPVLHLVEGVNTGLTWPSIELRHGRDLDGRHLLLLAGTEPDLRWRAFAAGVADLTAELGGRLVVGFGAYPAPVPHTRDVRLASTATTSELAHRVGQVRSTIDVPAGVQGAIERRCADAGLPAVGLWAQVPYYVANMAYPQASAALVAGLTRLGTLRLDDAALRDAGRRVRTQLDAVVADNPEHEEMVHGLERAHDTEMAGTGPAWGPDLPSGDELAAEVERFLRDVGQGGGQD